MRFPPQLLDDIRARLSVSQVVARKVALKRAGREFRGLSPFKVEKSPSFFVNDQKGFYHCFASGEHGDIFTFLMKTEGLSFPEAVERLAAEAGVVLPKPEARDQEREDARTRLYALVETTAKFFEETLNGAGGAEARRYIDGRGLSRETVKLFRIGYAPASRTALKEHLKRLGFSIEEQISAGTLIGGEDIREPYDRFRNRVMFPITDLKDRVIAFGGRALEKDVPAKYLNSPETPLFHKGALLFNAAKARPLAHDHQRVIVVEGYMDVVSLAQAGFGESVAPLGTALTEEQVHLLWRMVPEPILCFDGDSAGRKAAHRAIDVILPHLKPGVSAGIAFLPDGLDPDDLIRQEGPEAMNGVLARARPLADVLWEREFNSGDWSTPERRARLEQQINVLVGRIADPAVRAHYGSAMRERLYQAWGPARRASHAQSGRWTGGADRMVQNVAKSPHKLVAGARRPPFQLEPQRPTASQSLRRSGLVEGEAGRPPYREALILRTLVNHPWLVEQDAELIARLELGSPAMARLRDALLSLLSDNISLDRAQIRSQLERSSLDKVFDLVERAITHRCDRFAEPDADAAEVETGWRHTLALHERQTGLRKALAAAERTFHEEGSEDALARIVEIQRQIASSETIDFPTET
jgi:DNA primase